MIAELFSPAFVLHLESIEQFHTDGPAVLLKGVLIMFEKAGMVVCFIKQVVDSDLYIQIFNEIFISKGQVGYDRVVGSGIGEGLSLADVFCIETCE